MSTNEPGIDQRSYNCLVYHVFDFEKIESNFNLKYKQQNIKEVEQGSGSLYTRGKNP